MTLSIFSAARAAPESVALICGDVQLRYRELALRVARTARSLAARGLLGDRAPIAVVARPTLQSIEVLHALIAAAVPVVLLHPALPPSEQQALAERAGTRALLRPDDEDQVHDALEPWFPDDEEPDHTLPLAIVPTSGSTGTPKLVVLSRGAFIASARASAANLPLDAHDRWLLCLPPAHVGGFSILTRSVLAASAVVLFEPGARGLMQALPGLAECLERTRVTVVSLVPAVLDALLSALPNWRPSASLRAVLVGGAALSESLFARALERGVPLLTTYGLTEACSQVTTSRPGQRPSVRDGVVSSGFALPGVELELRERMRICIRAPSLCGGYLGIDAPLNGEGWFATEDRGYLDANGELYVLGRIGDLIVSGGENVDPLRVEAALSACAGVSAAVVFGMPDARYGEVVACGVLANADFDLSRLSSCLRGRLSRYELPRRIALLDALPTLANGKVDRARVRTLCSDRLQPFEHPRD